MINKGFLVGKIIKQESKTYGKRTKVLETVVLTQRKIYQKNGKVSYEENPILVSWYGNLRENAELSLETNQWVAIEYEIRGRKYEGKYYVSLTGTEYTILTQGNIVVDGDDVPLEPEEDDDIPF